MDTPDKPNDIKPPVFISYSHDSDEHKTWVRNLATRLRKVGIDVILDQWEIGPGDDVPKFMEKSVRRSHRVIMVCTEEYVRKANDGKGGAGYEAMVVTGELVNDLGTRKFIPVVRQSGETISLPDCVSTRFYVDFSQDDLFEAKLAELARDINDSPEFEKPPLGDNPYGTREASSGENDIPDQANAEGDPYCLYELSLSLANAGNFSKWHQCVEAEKSNAAAALLRWRADNEGSFPLPDKNLPDVVMPAVTGFGGLFAAAFGGIDSSDTRFHNQLGLLDWILKPKGWQYNGSTQLVQIPQVVFFTYQALVGALAMNRCRPDLVFNLANTVIRDVFTNREAVPLFKNYEYSGWPESLGGNCKIAWDFLQRIAGGWKWLWKLFGSEENTKASIVSYYLFLNTLDFVSATKSFKEGDAELRDIIAPFFISRTEQNVNLEAKNLLFAEANFIGEIFEENGIGTGEKLRDLWSMWMGECKEWVRGVYRVRFAYPNLMIPHSDLPQFLRQGSGSRIVE